MTTSVTLRFAEVGWRTTVQDLGRKGSERLGVPRGGAADQGAARIANILVGNPQNAPLLESLGGSVSFTASSDILISATGSIGFISIGGCAVESDQPIAVPAGAVVRVDSGEHAARSYVAVGGMLRCARFLGSAAPDARMGFTQSVRVGAELILDATVTRIEHPHLGRALFRLPLPQRRSASDSHVVDIVDCAETDSIPGIRELLAGSTYTVNNSSDHVGIRLDGPVLHPPVGAEILSHGVPIGALEIPHSDELIVLGRYRTLTAGYPIVGFVTRHAQDIIGQARPGQELEFAWADRSAARARALRFEGELAVLTAASLNAFAALGLEVLHTATLADGPLT